MKASYYLTIFIRCSAREARLCKTIALSLRNEDSDAVDNVG